MGTAARRRNLSGSGRLQYDGADAGDAPGGMGRLYRALDVFAAPAASDCNHSAGKRHCRYYRGYHISGVWCGRACAGRYQRRAGHLFYRRKISRVFPPGCRRGGSRIYAGRIPAVCEPGRTVGRGSQKQRGGGGAIRRKGGIRPLQAAGDRRKRKLVDLGCGN